MLRVRVNVRLFGVRSRD
jgi:hypothetical protein